MEHSLATRAAVVRTARARGFTDQTTLSAHRRLRGCLVGGWHASYRVLWSRSPAMTATTPVARVARQRTLCSGNFFTSAPRNPRWRRTFPRGRPAPLSPPLPNLFFAAAQSGPGCAVCSVDNVCTFTTPLAPTARGSGACVNDLVRLWHHGKSRPASCGALNMTSGSGCGALHGGWLELRQSSWGRDQWGELRSWLHGECGRHEKRCAFGRRRSLLQELSSLRAPKTIDAH